ncbi:MAG: hypothetical protein SV201_13740 [Pseudomonadota bacterium]|nr:hypothetical protein [Pseudomonadota bacterium]
MSIKGINVSFEDRDTGMEDVLREIQARAKFVDIGIQPDEDEELLKIAATHEYGAKIDHPGGTPYGYRTQNDAQNGRVRFLKKGEGYMVLGHTKPHQITIPARPYIRSTVDENEENYFHAAERLSGQMVDGRIEKYQALSLMGQLIEGDIKQKIVEIKDPPNAPATVRRKGSANPLVDTGLLGGSIRYVVHNGDDNESNQEAG